MSLSWKRPVSSEYPKTWHTFSVSRENYRIQDLPQSMTDEALQFLKENFFGDEPLSTAYNLHEDEYYLDRVDEVYRTIVIKQKAVLACFKEGSDEIVGINMNYVEVESNFLDRIKETWQNVYSTFELFYRVYTDKNYELNTQITSNENIERFEKLLQLIRAGCIFQTDKVLTAAGLCVARKYRGRGIAVELLKTRRPFCKEFNIKWTANIFSSHESDRCAEKAGFKLDKKFSYDNIRKNYPDLKVPTHIKSNVITHRSMEIDEDNPVNEIVNL